MSDAAITSGDRFTQVLAEVDRLNGGDPRTDVVDGVSRPREVVYAERMSAALARIYPNASEALRIAARAQHICRWQVPRERYPAGRDGYNAWRAAARDHHAALTTGILRQLGYPEPEIAHVAKLIRKEDLKRDAEAQALENVVGAVFVEHYMATFAAGHPDFDEAKLVGILRKTMRKMDATGHTAVRAIALPPELKRLVEAALGETRS